MCWALSIGLLAWRDSARDFYAALGVPELSDADVLAGTATSLSTLVSCVKRPRCGVESIMRRAHRYKKSCHAMPYHPIVFPHVSGPTSRRDSLCPRWSAWLYPGAPPRSHTCSGTGRGCATTSRSAQRWSPLGRVVQVDPMKPTLKASGTKRLKRKCDKLLSILLQFCFQSQLAALQLGSWTPLARPA